MVRKKTKQEIYDSISDSGRNFNEEMMVNLWHDYHFHSQKKFKFLYYDPK